MANALFLFDAAVDRDEQIAPGLAVMSGQAAQFESYHLLHGLFPPESPFWPQLRCHLAELACACLAEQHVATHGFPWDSYDDEMARQIARGKAAVAKAAVSGLEALGSVPAQAAALMLSIDNFAVGKQMLDDLADWRKDLANRTPSLLLARIARAGSPLPERDDPATWRAWSVALYYDGHAADILKFALRAFDLAAAVSDALPWHSVVARERRQCMALLEDVERIVASNIKRTTHCSAERIAIPEPRNAIEGVAHQALRGILREFRRGFGEARHIMHLPAEAGFAVQHDYHFGDVFQRALIAEGLCDADDALGGALRGVTKSELTYLLSQRRRDSPGGWSYFPSVPEIAADADDLGQVMQVLLRCQARSMVDATCSDALELLLGQLIHEDGGFETWLVPRDQRTMLQARQAEMNATRWGVGPDVEVVANLLYALTLYDEPRFAHHVGRGLDFVASRQSSDGHWDSRWYHGPYYGTYVCMRVLSTSRRYDETMSRAAAFLRQGQRIDGGWPSEEGASDSLSTSLAVLGLVCAANSAALAPNSLEGLAKAMGFLAQQAKDDLWPASPFIRPRVGEVYASKTMTTMYVMKAAFACCRTFRDSLSDVPRVEHAPSGSNGA
jgi:squalene-hopene/tetraprenyl-beta-curcumene cyclase